MNCKCGHSKEEHYSYILNGRPQSRCKGCDPWKGAGGGVFVIDAGSKFEQQDRAADHDFVESAASSN